MIQKQTLSSLNLRQRLGLFTNLYLRLSLVSETLRKFYQYIRDILDKAGNILPSWPSWSGRVSPIAAMPVIEKLTEDIKLGSRGSFYFAHILLPHYPYVYDRNCRIRMPIWDWKNRMADVERQSSEDRAVRYSLYFEQIRCTVTKLREMFDSMKAAGKFRDTIIILHGDHESRIVLSEPRVENTKELTSEDFVDAFSTPFAVKAPNYTKGYDSAMRPLTDILWEIHFDSVQATPVRKDHYVYLTDTHGGWVRTPLPDIPREFQE